MNGGIANLERACSINFGMEMHQVRHLLETLTPISIAREWLVSVQYQANFRRAFGLANMTHSRRQGRNGHGGIGISAWRTPDPVRGVVA